MPRYSVRLPITGYVLTEVEAADEKAAIKKALNEGDFTNNDIEEWEVHEQTVRGNVAYGSCTQADAELIGD